MIYLDTSWLVKLYVDEPGAPGIRQAVGNDPDLVVSELAYVEFHSAVARRRRQRAIPARTARLLVERFRQDWDDRVRVPVSQDVLLRAADIVAAHPLRSLDALQLASALLVAEGMPEPLGFGAADDRLVAAAAAEGLTTLTPAT